MTKPDDGEIEDKWRAVSSKVKAFSGKVETGFRPKMRQRKKRQHAPSQKKQRRPRYAALRKLGGRGF